MIDELERLPDVSFTGNLTLGEVEERMAAAYMEKERELTGREPSHSRADPEMLELYACAVEIYNLYLAVEHAGQMCTLKNARGEFLDHKASLLGVERGGPARAGCTIRFTLSAARESAVTIPAGTRVTGGDGIFFQTVEPCEVRAGETTADARAEAMDPGAAANGIPAGGLSELVDQTAYVSGAASTTETAGGTDGEGDDDLRERVYYAPRSFSVAGPKGAYEYFARSLSPSIGSVRVDSPAPGEVDVLFLMDDGSLPQEEMIQRMEEELNGELVRPLTDKVVVKKPEERKFDIKLAYHVGKSRLASSEEIQAAVDAAVDGYAAWQQAEIGRDVNPAELIRAVMNAGAKRVTVYAPAYARVGDSEVARLGDKSVTYGGIEDD